MIGLILCGGNSNRMKSDKGLIMENNIPWARIAFNKLAELGLNVVLSINSDQKLNYQAFFAPDHLVVDDESLLVGGPLKGLLTIHKKHPYENVFLFACDMPLMDKTVLVKILETAKRKNSRDAFVYENEGNSEPLCAIYTSTALQQVMELYQNNQLQKQSMKYVLEQVDTLTIPIPEEWKIYFTNYNSPDELSTLKV